jgi:flavin reductase
MLRETFLEGMRRTASGVAVVTTRAAEGHLGVTVSALCSLSADPPSLIVCIHHLSPTVQAILESGFFCANILSEEQRELSELFAGRAGISGGERFTQVPWQRLATGAPALKGALASFDCTLVKEMRWGSHHVIVGTVCDIELGGTGRPLIHCNRSYGGVALDPA